MKMWDIYCEFKVSWWARRLNASRKVSLCMLDASNSHKY
jgi:hypothetical protein